MLPRINLFFSHPPVQRSFSLSLALALLFARVVSFSHAITREQELAAGNATDRARAAAVLVAILTMPPRENNLQG